jgi:asparagine synthase (glutamine-hydrolysing)
MSDSIIHRGPDDSGTFVDRGIGLAMRRLSIIDRSGGHQPMFNEDGSIACVFNGEIYNFKELRNECEKLGHHFSTSSDTEVIVHLYETFGAEMLQKLRGMFAIALWDSNTKTLLLARDRLGKKPLYYTSIDGTLLFASEIKALLRHPGVPREVDTAALNDYLTLQYVPGPRTMFAGISKLQPGSYMLVGHDRRIEQRAYWNVEVRPGPAPPDAAARCLDLLRSAVQERLMSEVPLGVFLSGGIDSSAIVACMSGASNSIRTFTAAFGQPDDELKWARLVADHFGTEHTELFIDSTKTGALPDMAWHLDEPLADPAAVPTLLLARKTKPHATVVLLGEGGDETFGGYERYGIMRRLASAGGARSGFRYLTPFLSRSGPLVGAKRADFLGEFAKVANDDYLAYERISAFGFTEREKTALSGGHWHAGPTAMRNWLAKPGSIYSRMLTFDQQVWLPDRLLMKVDKMTMAASVEARTPFLDHRLVEFANSLPPGLRLNKVLLKRSLHGILPKAILNRRKHGFAVPLGSWFGGEMHGVAAQMIDSWRSGQYVDPTPLRGLLENPRRFRADHRLWTALSFELWYRTFIEGDGRKPVVL